MTSPANSAVQEQLKELSNIKLTESITALDVSIPTIGTELVQNKIILPTANFRNRQDSILGKIMGRSATLIVFATAGLLSIAEGIASLALSVLTSPTLLLSKEAKLSKWLFSRAASAMLSGIMTIANGVLQLGRNNEGELPQLQIQDGILEEA